MPPRGWVTPLIAAVKVLCWAAALTWASESAMEAIAKNVPASEQELLIGRLGHPHPAVREAAEREIKSQGEKALDLLTTAMQDKDPEVAARARFLFGLTNFTWPRPTDTELTRTFLEVYGQVPDNAVHIPLSLIDSQFQLDGLAALCRIVRYERSAKRSKMAALWILTHHPPDAETWDRQRDLVHAGLGDSRQAAAEWLRTAFSAEFDSLYDGSLGQPFLELAQAEQASLEAAPSRSEAFLVAGLYLLAARYHFDATQIEEAAEPLRIGQELMANNEAVRDAVVGRFGDRFPFDWVEKSYVAVLDGYRKSVLGMRAHDAQRICRVFSELLHDQGWNEEAADYRKLLGDTQEELYGAEYARGDRARELCFRALHFVEQGDTAQARTLLEQALRQDATDADALIAQYRLTEKDGEARARVVRSVEKAVKDFRAQIELSQQAPTGAESDVRENTQQYYNLLAWLVANTEGDVAEAIRMSEKSLEISPNSGALLDTLAHCYYAAGNYAKAVECQRRAARLEPYSRLITSQLKVFEDKLAETTDMKTPSN